MQIMATIPQFPGLSGWCIPEATRFIKGLASEAESVKAQVSVANMARSLKQLQPSRGGRWCCAKRGAFLHDPCIPCTSDESGYMYRSMNLVDFLWLN